MATLLLVEDSDVQRADLRVALEAAGLFDRILEAGDGIEGLRVLLSEPVDFVLCDLEMPGLDGSKLVAASMRPDGRPIPFIVLTAVDDLDRKARLLRQGARDAITKPFHLADLIARIQLHLELVRLQEELMAKNRQLEELSVTDPLTGLRNRRYLDEILRLDFLRAERFGTELSVLMVDVDHFKRVNDAFGHPAGDRVLCELSELLTARLRASDVAGRYGGEEFLLILAGIPLAGAATAAERWRRDIEQAAIRSERGDPIPVTVSIGVAARRADMQGPAALVAAADAALYHAKAAGRNRVALPL